MARRSDNSISFSRFGRPFFLAVWFVLVSGPLVIFHASKTVPLPLTEVEIEPKARQNEEGNWTMVHILAEGCACSARTAEYLIDRSAKRDRGFIEETWIVGEGESLASQLMDAGYEIQSIDGETLVEKWGVHGGPWLMVFNRDGEIRYSGGYAQQRPVFASDFQDLALTSRLIAGEAVEVFPAFGCATSRWLQREMDPIGIKYTLKD